MTGVIIIILIGLFLLLVEFLLIPGITVAGVGGVILIAGGITWAYTGFGTTAGHLTLLGTAIASVTVVVLALRSKTWKRLQLNTKIDSKVNEIDANKFTVGMVGKAISRLAPMGTGQFGDKFVEVTSPQNFIDVNSDIVITKIEGNKIFVNQNNTL